MPPKKHSPPKRNGREEDKAAIGYAAHKPLCAPGELADALEAGGGRSGTRGHSAPPRKAQRAGPTRAGAVAALVALAVVNIAAVLSLRNIPTLDGPMLLYYADAFRSLLAGHAPFHSYYQLHYIAGAHVFYFYFVAALSAFLGLLTVEKIFVAIYIAWLVYAFYYLAESIAPGRSFPAVLLIFPFAMNIAVYWAFYDFSIGLATALFVCGWWLRYFDRLTPRRSALWAAFMALLTFMHLMPMAVVLLFAGMHLAAYGGMRYLDAKGGFVSRARSAAGEILNPAAHVAGGLALWYFMKPPGRLSMPGYPFFESTLDRFYEIAVMRALSPYESRFYRAMLALVVFGAIAITAKALWRTRRSLSPRAEWMVAVIGLFGFVAYMAVPFWMADGAFFPQRFALIGILFLLASSALCVLSRRQRVAIGAVAAVISVAALVYQHNMNVSQERKYAATLDLPPLVRHRLAALVNEDNSADPSLTYNAQFWTGVNYVRRSGMALLNSPWLEQRDKWVAVRESQTCQFMNPNLMRGCLLLADDKSEKPPIDVLIGVRTEPAQGGQRTLTANIARRYGLTRVVWESPYMSIYALPELIQRRD